jgi:hypothetical protein
MVSMPLSQIDSNHLGYLFKNFKFDRKLILRGFVNTNIELIDWTNFTFGLTLFYDSSIITSNILIYFHFLFSKNQLVRKELPKLTKTSL